MNQHLKSLVEVLVSIVVRRLEQSRDEADFEHDAANEDVDGRSARAQRLDKDVSAG